MKKNLIIILISLIFVFVSFYIILPPLNPSSFGFWGYIVLVSIVIYFLFTIGSLEIDKNMQIITKNRKTKVNKVTYIIIPIVLIIPILMIINIFGSPIFNASSYYERITVSDGNFENDIETVNFNTLALLDKDSSTKLGDRVMGQLTDLVSQFYVSNLYTQITYQDSITRVTPLEYDGLIKYFTNKEQGVPGYITVNSVTGESSLTRLDSGMKYMESAYFSEDLYRKLRFDYLTENFGEMTFEIDDEGNPYWIIPTIKYTLVGLRPETDGVIVFNPIDGTSEKYELNEIPEWVDHVHDSDLIIEQLNDWGLYKNGYINSILGQKEVVMTTTGYNYLSLNGDTYLYTGITSVASDESNIGFVMVNLRTKETKFYNVPGAEEYSAMASAEGQVQNLNYTATFPLLVNLNGKPTYLMSLKDNAGLVKMYALVDYTDYQKVTVADSSLGIEHLAQLYIGNNINTDNTEEIEITIEEIESGVVDGNTYYYIKTEDNTYRASLKINELLLPFLKTNDTILIIISNNEILKITN